MLVFYFAEKWGKNAHTAFYNGDEDKRKIVKEAGKMGALIWGIFVLIVTVVLERDCFFS